jgi:hypothetical protein
MIPARMPAAPTSATKSARTDVWYETVASHEDRTMSEGIAVALISGGSSVLIAVTALILNYRGFASIDARMNLMQSDMKDLNKTMTAIEIDVALLKDKVH